MTRSILFRTDASLSIGSGHVMRCRTLARELRRRGGAITFLCRRQPGDLIGLLEQEFTVLALPKLPLAETHSHQDNALKGRELYGNWLGCSQEQDADDSLQALRKSGMQRPSWVVVDHYGLDAKWENQVLAAITRDVTPRLLVIDDLADRSHQADLLLDQNFFGANTEGRYAGLVPKHCRQMLGPHNALLGPEYALFHSLVPLRTELRRVLVFFGGVDPDNLTGRALEALMVPELEYLAVDVVLGIQSQHRQVVADQVALRANTTLHDPLPSLAGLITRADLAIGAGGATTWERACLGLPSLVVDLAENQRGFNEILASHGVVLLIEEINLLSKAIHSLCRDHGGFQRMSISASSMVDGQGSSRVADALIGTSNSQKVDLDPNKVNPDLSMLQTKSNQVSLSP